MTSTGNLELYGYGKLSASREYVRIRSDRGPAFLFREFLDQAAGNLLKCTNPDNPLMLLVTLPNREGTIVAGVWRSSDAGGHRPYPFSFYTALDPARLKGCDSCFWTRLQPVFHDLFRSFPEVRAARDRTTLEKFLGPAYSVVASPISTETAQRLHEEAASKLLIRDFSQEAFGDSGEKFCSALWRLAGLFKETMHPGDKAGVVRLPLAGVFPVAAQVDAWLSLMAVRATENLWPPDIAVILPKPGKQGSLYIFFRPIIPEDVATFQMDLPARGIADLAVFQEPAIVEGFGSFHRWVQGHISSGLTLNQIDKLLEVIPK